MKTLPGTRRIVIAVIGLVSVAAILVFAQPPTPTPAPNFELVLKCAKTTDQTPAGKQRVVDALKNNPSLKGHAERFKIRYNDGAANDGIGQYIGSGQLNEPNEHACPHHSGTNVTQRLQFANSADLKQFLTDAGL